MSPLLMDNVDLVGGDNPETEAWNGWAFEQQEGASNYASNQPRTSWSTSTSVISYEGDMLVVDQEVMVVGQPYATVFEDVPVVVLKRESGDVDFYYIDP